MQLETAPQRRRAGRESSSITFSPSLSNSPAQVRMAWMPPPGCSNVLPPRERTADSEHSVVKVWLGMVHCSSSRSLKSHQKDGWPDRTPSFDTHSEKAMCWAEIEQATVRQACSAPSVTLKSQPPRNA
eukprot:evm.model.scf_672.10 EVM.evm.TU.scf_672.10   scf_672:55727-58036(-)